MAFTDESGAGMVMPVSPMYGNGNGGFGFGNDSGWWIILLFILLGNNGWGNGYGGGNAPYMVDNSVQRGFDQSAVMNGLTGIQAAVTGGFGDVQAALCSGFAGVSNGFAQAEIAENARQMANMNQMFALQSQLADCCCENRLASADLRYTIATENCNDRAALSDGIRDILVANQANTQRILDTMCQDKIDAKNEKIAELQNALTMANLAASQNAQTATILANNEAQTSALEQYLAPVPRPAYIVQNPSCCQNTAGCGCGCGCGF